MTMQCVEELGQLNQVVLGGGLIWTKNKSAQGEFDGMDTVMKRGRKVLTRWAEVTILVANVWHNNDKFDPIADGGLVDPKDFSWHKVRATMNDNAASGTASKITEAVLKAAEDFYGKEKWGSFSEEEKKEKSVCYNFTCWNHNSDLFIKHGLRGMQKWLDEKLEQSVSKIDVTWVRSDIADIEGSARAVWKEFATTQ
jgi:hypothetical protein